MYINILRVLMLIMRLETLPASLLYMPRGPLLGRVAPHSGQHQPLIPIWWIAESALQVVDERRELRGRSHSILIGEGDRRDVVVGAHIENLQRTGSQPIGAMEGR